VRPFGSTDIDVIGPAGELISVGGLSKTFNLGRFGRELKILATEASRRGVGVKVALERGVPQSLIDFASKRVGIENVIIFD
jgi:filamentous hemagglutinin